MTPVQPFTREQIDMHVSWLSLHDQKTTGAIIRQLIAELDAYALRGSTPMLKALSDIREVTGVGHKPMLSELGAAIGKKIKELEDQIAKAKGGGE
jgi:hypothetical protein